MTEDERLARRRKQMAEASRRYRERHPEYRKREKERMRRVVAARDPEAERRRIALYRATHPVQTYLTDLRARRRRQGQREGVE